MQMRLKIFAVFLTASSLISVPINAQDPVTGVLLGGVEGKINDVLDHATANGDFLIQRMAQQALALIKAWKESNESLLNTGFDRLDSTTQALFNDMKTTFSRLEEDKTIAVHDVERLSAIWSGTIKGLPFTNHDPEVFDYYPRVIRPVGGNLVPVHIVGPKLASAGPALVAAKSQTAVDLRKATDTELIANVERQKLSFNDDSSNLVSYSLTFNDGKFRWLNPKTWFRNDVTARDITVWLLPKNMADYEIAVTVPDDKTDSKTFPITLSPHGKDSTYPGGVAVPPDLLKAGYEIDVAKVLAGGFWGNPAQSGGSSCSGPDRNTITPQGFTFNMQLGHETDSVGHKSDGSVTCTLTVTVNRTIKGSKAGDAIRGNLNWTDDVLKALPPQTISYTITLKMFDGRSYILKDKAVEPYGVVEIIKQPGSVMFRPHPPNDF